MKTESVLGFLAGAAVGALAGILFAPAAGDETRKKIMEAASEGYDEAREQAEVLGHKAEVRDAVNYYIKAMSSKVSSESRKPL